MFQFEIADVVGACLNLRKGAQFAQQSGGDDLGPKEGISNVGHSVEVGKQRQHFGQRGHTEHRQMLLDSQIHERAQWETKLRVRVQVGHEGIQIAKLVRSQVALTQNFMEQSRNPFKLIGRE